METDEMILELLSQLTPEQEMAILEEIRIMLEQDKVLEEYYTLEESYRRSYEFDNKDGKRR